MQELDDVGGLDQQQAALPFQQVEMLLGKDVQIGIGPRLVWIWNGRRRQRAIEERLVVGRSKHADVVIPHMVFSRRHFELLLTARGTAFFDLGSCNGTLVNDVSVTTCVLAPGDLINVCGVVFLYIE